MIFPRLRSVANAARKRGWKVIDILGGSPEKFFEALGYPEEVHDAFETFLKLTPLSAQSRKICASGT